MPLTTIVLAVLTLAIGLATGYALRRQIGLKQDKSVEQQIHKKIEAAKEKVNKLRRQAEEETRAIRKKSDKEIDHRRHQVIELEQSIGDREKEVSNKVREVKQKEQQIDATSTQLKQKQSQLDIMKAEEETKLAEIAGLTEEQAAQRMMTLAEDRTKEDIVRRLRKLHKNGEKQLEEKARDILAMIIQRYAASQVAESTTSHVSVPDESMIGRIIGKEGRNIQHLEHLTGCEIIIDETPNSIMISGFSPVRRQVAKTALEKLLKDGRIHPGRIEEVVDDAKQKINEEMRAAGETVVYDLGIIDLPDKLVQLIGRLKYRTSYRQNILRHSWEAAHLATMLAEELGANVNIAKKATLLHDIGKAIDHEVEGDHIQIGEKILRKFGVDEAVIAAAAAHHEDYPFATMEATIVQVSDAISAARPGARRENTEEYIKRMENLENIATSHEGVNKAYAIYAGREIRVFVTPDQINDLQAIKLSQNIAKEIEQELTYPGEVKVNIIRETRAHATAH